MKLKNVKRVIATAMVSVMALSMTACGGSGDSTSKGGDSKQEASTDKVERPEAVSEASHCNRPRLRSVAFAP